MPKITKIEEQKKNSDRVSVYIDDKFAFGVPKYAAEKNKLKEGQEVNEVQLKQVMYDAELERAKAYIVNYHLNKTTHIIRKKLQEKGFDEEVIEGMLDFIDRYQLVDNKDYGRRFTHDHLYLKRKGKRRISQELKQKGLTEQEISSVLKKINSEDEVLVATEALQKKVATYRRKAKTPYEFKNKCYVYLAGRGFSTDIITQAIERVESEEEE
mgnify:CR=1 FL=1